MSRREYTRRVIEHSIPTNPPWGATIADFSKAWTFAEREYRELSGLADGALPDDAIRIHPSDEEIVIRFEIEAPPQ